MEFEWDSEKSRFNKIKHDVSFEEAIAVWENIHMEVRNLAHSEDTEKRSATMGWIGKKLYVVIWTKRKNKIRIISVRRAREREEAIFFKKVQE
ncbi:MAG: hypothetical protein A3F82_08410 [Deltaproteobacteria bacterium RIFCSPLOWO2_12_FULL_44_12]|nr:MAG: hypothetical protein A2712_06860 [Deltaproteobacteria bacterium RIFCSPHIGHO2_01_FULL_43_49]OGQ15669.1 MAG: hypothetical protein A3D22_05650 [Deltaproteobacteria bacterium RIFCSPHIGHO2_02_FULL_44_53]OGQ28638.1 MAG: hypothetical protein A3D98_00385 [Deltaproteobacteria bacterium RIFCSPHIGHO2_12_FULL_44_21]OGQ31960.1 MAG: hypothetical protein A2979_02590 [Deltaproteobacteria bacterium RIFCSPLOWO2_01_FULL_45_74]OGQ43575.1 MAG: hypothetical protein A3I70_03115 [Deltaproteobacteria bacterium 